MRSVLLLALLPFVAHAQPGDELFPEPCGSFPYEEVDLTGDGLPDLAISGMAEGTDDEPSSCGQCTRMVQCLPGTTLLMSRDPYGMIAIRSLARGDTLTSAQLTEGLRKQQLFWWQDQVPVVHWGYGCQAGRPLVWDKGIKQRTFMFRTVNGSEVRRGIFRITYDPVSGRIAIVRGWMIMDEAGK